MMTIEEIRIQHSNSGKDMHASIKFDHTFDLRLKLKL